MNEENVKLNGIKKHKYLYSCSCFCVFNLLFKRFI